jgi:serine/threonine protein kinase
MHGNGSRDVELFTEALELPTGERASFLARACAGDEDLRLKVEALLKANDRPWDFLEQPPAGVPPEDCRKYGTSRMAEPGERIGRYKLLQQIGEGGWGVVFMAEQEEPVRRRVALKVVKPGMDTKSVIARFEAERQALALMDHPNIARVFDAGATENGRPYFVMELIRGVKITDYCDQQSVPTAERLELFIQVCDAVQHAHQKGIIHRDIKPANILVTTLANGKPLPKVIDFGIAKATTGLRLTDKTLFTAFEMLIGTPAYMSPEQAELTSVDVDTRTDIYSLGVLLYELLTSTTPFDAHELLKAGLDEVRRVIRTEEPARPSTRLSGMMAANLTTVSQQRQADPPKLLRDVRGDVDWIVMKALDKDRGRRYPTANALALDIRRYLAGEIILARPPSSLYRLRKLCQRNKLLVGGLAIFFLLLVVLLGFLSLLLVREKKLREQSDLLAADTLTDAYARDGKLEQAETICLRGLEIRRKMTPGALPTRQSLEAIISVLLTERGFDQAEVFLDNILTSADTKQEGYIDLLDLRAEVFARSGRWTKAQGDAQRLHDLQPEEFGYYHLLAPLMVENNDLEGYQRLCQEIAARFSSQTSDPIRADQMAKDRLILPSSGVDLNPVAALAEVAVDKGKFLPPYPYFQCCKALAEYRQGHFAEAVKWAQQAAINPFPFSQAEACAILAMGQYKLNQVAEAHITLAKCEQIIETRFPVVRYQELGGDWRDWIIAHTLLTEAQNLLGSRSPAPEMSHPTAK